MSNSGDDRSCCLLFVVLVGLILAISGIAVFYTEVIKPVLDAQSYSQAVATMTATENEEYPVSTAQKSGSMMSDNSGGVYLDGGGSLEFHINISNAGNYTFRVVTDPNSDWYIYASVEARVNGGSPISMNIAEHLTGGGEYTSQTCSNGECKVQTDVTITLKAGSNIIQLSNQQDECNQYQTSCTYIGGIVLIPQN